MADHDVSIKLPPVPIQSHDDVVFKIKIDGKMFGLLTVTKDSLVWFSSETVSRETFEVSWKAFDEWMRARNDLLR
jgi:hypothetical protein